MLEVLPMIIDWTPTTGLMPGSTRTCTWPMAPPQGLLGKGKLQCCEVVVLLELEFYAAEQNLIPNVWQLVIVNVPIKG